MCFFNLQRGGFTSKAALLLLTFVVGIAATFLWFEFTQPTVTLCELAQNRASYLNRIVRVEADAQSAGESIQLRDGTCKLPETWTDRWREAVTVGYETGHKPFVEVQPLFTQSLNAERYQARVVVVGQFEELPGFACFAPKYAIRATDVQLKSVLTTKQTEQQK